ncbi:MAG: CHAT domain-containing tetratricopeptide repeat protein [Scytonema sp. PMC 1069.18]|nr:CHAT domain-containing tetratricopeptide repeat protein [Scytonema sp. PMC 1069.18]
MTIRSCKIGLGVFFCLFAVVSTSLGSSLPMVFTVSQVLAQTNTERKAEAEKVMQRGREQLQSSQFTAALQSWQQALLIYREIKDRQGEGKTLVNLGLAYHFLGDYRKAIEYYQQSLPILREIKDSKTEGIALYNFGNTYDSLGDYHKAIEYHQQSLKIAQEIKDREGEGAVFGSLGNAYYSLRDYPKAIEYHQQSLKITQEIKNRQGEGAAFGNLGSIYNDLGDYPKAIEYHQLHLKIAQEIKYRLGERQALGNLGVVYHSLGNYLKAIESHQQSLAIAQEIQDRQGEGQSLANIGIAYLALGDYPRAIKYQQQRLKIAQEIQDRQGEGQSLANIGIAYRNLEDYPKAIKYQQQSLKIAQEIQDRQVEGNVLGGLGNTYYSLGDYPKAIKYQQQRLKISQKINDRRGEGAALNNLGINYYKQGNFKLAESILLEGIKVLESLRGRELKDNDKVYFFDMQSSIYRILQQVLIAQNQTDRALEIAERGRGRAFVELLASQVSSNPQELLSNPPNIDQMKQIAKSQNATLVQYSIITDEFKVAGRQKAEESELYIWVIKPTGEVTFRKADLKPLWQKENINLEELVKISRQSIGVRSRGIRVSHNPNPGKAQNNLKRLHQVLINPIADLLPKKETDKVIFIPQNSLFLVPFPALQDKDGKYLIEKHTILTSPSIQVLDLTRQQRQNGKQQPRTVRTGANFTSPLIVGNPTMPKVALKIGDKPQQLTSLPGAEKEAKAIASLLNTQALIGNNATEAAIVQRLSQAGIIHFATHGLFDDIRGLDSAIALAPSEGRLALAPSETRLTLTPENISFLSSPLSKEDKKRDGLLTAEEILDMKINADLVVLSACDTGRGRITGDGVIGLSRSLISAGTPSVIVSLWAVDDDSTAFLMTEFYQNLQQKFDKATALRNAMLTTKKKYSNPSQWAAFTLIGKSE